MRYRDPVTGDELSPGEWVSWKIQRVMRRWPFLGVITALTAYVWLRGSIWQLPLTDQWNLWASYGALAIEGITAMALINQCLRDAVVSRQTRANSQRIEVIEQQNAQLLAENYQMSQRLATIAEQQLQMMAAVLKDVATIEHEVETIEEELETHDP